MYNITTDNPSNTATTFTLQNSSYQPTCNEISNGTSNYEYNVSGDIINLGFGNNSGVAIKINTITINGIYNFTVGTNIANNSDSDNYFHNIWNCTEDQVVYTDTITGAKLFHKGAMGSGNFVIVVPSNSGEGGEGGEPTTPPNNSDGTPGDGEVQLGLYFGSGDVAKVTKNISNASTDITFEWSGSTLQGQYGTMYIKQTDLTHKYFDSIDVIITGININNQDITVPVPYQTASSALTDKGIFDIAFYNQWATDMNKNIGDKTGLDYKDVTITSMKITLRFSNVAVKQTPEEIAQEQDVTTTEATTQATTEATTETTTETINEDKGTKIVTLTKTIDSGRVTMSDGQSAVIKEYTLADILGDIPKEDVQKLQIRLSLPSDTQAYWYCGGVYVDGWDMISFDNGKNPTIDVTNFLNAHSDVLQIQFWGGDCNYSFVLSYNAEVPLDYVPSTSDNSPVALFMIVMMATCAGALIIISRKKKFN